MVILVKTQHIVRRQTTVALSRSQPIHLMTAKIGNAPNFKLHSRRSASATMGNAVKVFLLRKTLACHCFGVLRRSSPSEQCLRTERRTPHALLVRRRPNSGTSESLFPFFLNKKSFTALSDGASQGYSHAAATAFDSRDRYLPDGSWGRVVRTNANVPASGSIHSTVPVAPQCP